MRYSSFLPAAFFLVVAALPGPLWAPPAATAADWPQWRGANRDGRVPALPRTMPELKLLWKHPVAGECDAGIAAVGSVVVAADHDEGHDYYRCLDAARGTETWVRSFPNAREMDYGAGPRATPLVERDKVYVLSAFGEFYCFDLKTGKTIWQLDFHKDFDVAKEPKWGCSSSPLIAGGKLIVNPGGGSAPLAALDPETGKVLWKGPGGGPNYASFIAGTFGGVEQVVGHDDTGLNGWDLNTGRRLWSINLEQGDGYIVPTPVSVGGKILITDTHNESQLFAFGPHGAIVAKPVAKSEDIAPEVITPVAAGDLLLGLSHALVCLDANDLSTLWSYKREPIFKRDCHLIVAQDRGLAFNGRGELVLFSFDRQGAKILGKKKLCGQTRMHPSLAAGRLYVRDGQFVYCYDMGLAGTGKSANDGDSGK